MINYSRPIEGQRLVWDSRKTFKIAWRKFKAKLIDYIVLVTKHLTEDKLEIVRSILNANVFEIFLGTPALFLLAQDESLTMPLQQQLKTTERSNLRLPNNKRL